jgi:uncharacterized lipoprotein YajG
MRTLALTLILIALAPVLAGCSSQPDTTNAAPPPSANAVADPPNPNKINKLPGAMPAPK